MKNKISNLLFENFISEKEIQKYIKEKYYEKKDLLDMDFSKNNMRILLEDLILEKKKNLMEYVNNTYIKGYNYTLLLSKIINGLDIKKWYSKPISTLPIKDKEEVCIILEILLKENKIEEEFETYFDPSCYNPFLTNAMEEIIEHVVNETQKK